MPAPDCPKTKAKYNKKRPGTAKEAASKGM